ncbi:hypothetical protein CO2235_180180 [Cupriavidus oxalaticus]|uniref:Uncharacterized protein n=1 Tax=Cupriavidus oxalaticus TaxID=96344 RepID=A0A375G3H6_9BURK|nr:hypothetical protein CO2235_180180 [Cupriavidus oxalaticus]
MSYIRHKTINVRLAPAALLW